MSIHQDGFGDLCNIAENVFFFDEDEEDGIALAN